MPGRPKRFVAPSLHTRRLEFANQLLLQFLRMLTADSCDPGSRTAGHRRRRLGTHLQGHGHRKPGEGRRREECRQAAVLGGREPAAAALPRVRGR